MRELWALEPDPERFLHAEDRQWLIDHGYREPRVHRAEDPSAIELLRRAWYGSRAFQLTVSVSSFLCVLQAVELLVT